MGQDAIKKLELRIKELEDQLKTARARPEPEDISADELQAYLKVREQLAVDWGDFCGPNDCMPIRRLCDRCIRWPSETISRCVHVCGCIFECFCGPCNVGGFGSGGIQRFSGLGG
jgi:hypothetical protein